MSRLCRSAAEGAGGIPKLVLLACVADDSCLLKATILVVSDALGPIGVESGAGL